MSYPISLTIVMFLAVDVATKTTEDAEEAKEEVVSDKDASVEKERVEENNNRDKNTEEEIVPEDIIRPDSKLIVILRQ